MDLKEVSDKDLAAEVKRRETVAQQKRIADYIKNINDRYACGDIKDISMLQKKDENLRIIIELNYPGGC